MSSGLKRVVWRNLGEINLSRSRLISVPGNREVDISKATISRFSAVGISYIITYKKKKEMFYLTTQLFLVPASAPRLM